MLLGCESESCYFGKDERFNVKEYEKTRRHTGAAGSGGRQAQACLVASR